MEELLKLLNFLAPGLSDVSEADKTAALEVAAGFRPTCLTADKQDAAQVYYALWLLLSRQAQSGTSGVAQPMPGVKSIKEGDVTVTYSDGAEAAGGFTDPGGFHAQWAALYKLCGGGITVGFKRNHRGHCC